MLFFIYRFIYYMYSWEYPSTNFLYELSNSLGILISNNPNLAKLAIMLSWWWTVGDQAIANLLNILCGFELKPHFEELILDLSQ